MSFNLSTLSSGSRANVTLIESGSQRFLIDCGLNAKQLELRLASLNVSPDTISGILISHEHSDHIAGLSVFTRRWKIPVYANYGTGQCLKNIYALEQFDTGTSFQIGSTTFHPFRINHDAVDPVGFVIYSEGLKLVHVTDIGKINNLLIDMLQSANAIVIEANHDLDLLHACDYSWDLKQRIASSHGHLENSETAKCLEQTISTELGFVVLAHLSENSNTPEVAKETVLARLNKFNFNNVICANPYQATELLAIGEGRIATAVGF